MLSRLILLFIAFLFFISFKFQTNKNVIVWNETRSLSWDDFRGKPEKRFAAASTSYDILKEVKTINSNSASVKITAVFFSKNSWKKITWINDQVLAHEQKHFDIVELYARKLRKKIKEISYNSFANIQSKVDSLYKINDKEMDAYQDLYDEETDGSMNGDKQREWMPKIMKEIKELDDYKEIVLKISF